MCCCRLGILNLDALVIIFKNWPIDARDECDYFAKFGVSELFVYEAKIMDADGDELQVASYLEENPTCLNDELDEWT